MVVSVWVAPLASVISMVTTLPGVASVVPVIVGVSSVVLSGASTVTVGAVLSTLPLSVASPVLPAGSVTVATAV